MNDYRPFDRYEKLGEPPWNPDDPKLIEWEQAHGHDVRLKCYPEFGCQVLENHRNALENAALRLLEAVEATSAYYIQPVRRCAEELREAFRR